jgi:circadian clock protein KaiC
MGLLDKAENVKKEAVSEENREINKGLIRDHHKETVKKQEKKDEVEPKVVQDLDTGKIHAHRPKERSKKIKSSKQIDLATIKSEIEAKLKKPGMQADSIEEHEEHHHEEGRIHTGIPGLDDVMEGGFKLGSVYLVGGGAGSGKSIFCMQFLSEGIDQHNENGIYISFEEDKQKILEDFKRFEWNIKEKIDNKQLVMLYYTPEQVEKVLESGGGIIRDTIESIGAKRLVIDSLTAFTLLHNTEIEKRRAVLRLFDEARKWGVTSLMTSEIEPDPDKHKSNVMEFETDGVILLYNIRKGDIRERALEIFKMRGTHHSAKIFPMQITKSGIKIYPEETVF